MALIAEMQAGRSDAHVANRTGLLRFNRDVGVAPTIY